MRQFKKVRLRLQICKPIVLVKAYEISGERELKFDRYNEKDIDRYQNKVFHSSIHFIFGENRTNKS